MNELSENDVIDNEISQGADTGLVVNTKIKGLLISSAKWALFLAVLGFVGVAFLLIGGLVISLAGSTGALGAMPGPFQYMGLFYLVLAIVYFFPAYYMAKYSARIKSSISSVSQSGFEEAIKYLQLQYKFYGITAIVIISLYLVVIIAFAGAGAAMMR